MECEDGKSHLFLKGRMSTSPANILDSRPTHHLRLGQANKQGCGLFGRNGGMTTPPLQTRSFIYLVLRLILRRGSRAEKCRGKTWTYLLLVVWRTPLVRSRALLSFALGSPLQSRFCRTSGRRLERIPAYSRCIHNRSEPR
jgi:hypothetical protein